MQLMRGLMLPGLCDQGGVVTETPSNGVPAKARGVGRAPTASVSGLSPPPGYLGEMYAQLSDRLNRVWTATLTATFGGSIDQCLQEGRTVGNLENFTDDLSEKMPVENFGLEVSGMASHFCFA